MEKPFIQIRRIQYQGADIQDSGGQKRLEAPLQNKRIRRCVDQYEFSQAYSQIKTANLRDRTRTDARFQAAFDKDDFLLYNSL